MVGVTMGRRQTDEQPREMLILQLICGQNSLKIFEAVFNLNFD